MLGLSRNYKLIRYMFSLLGLLLLVACASDGRRWDSQRYVVGKNDTLYAIAWRYRMDYRQLARWNNLKPPYTIYPGQQLVLHKVNHVSASAETQVNTRTGNQSSTGRQHNSSGQAPAKVVTGNMQWRWPVNGKVVVHFSNTASSAQSLSQGIDIAGNVGQAIKATSAGRVVYSGNGLVGYGNLVIVKHNDTYLSAYGYNRKLLVKEGEFVKAGQQIAEMGTSTASLPRLHFEIRKQGKPVDPLKYLPKR